MNAIPSRVPRGVRAGASIGHLQRHPLPPRNEDEVRRLRELARRRPLPMTWGRLTRMEPMLKKLYDEARAIKDDGEGTFCANVIWYDFFKPRLANYAGWRARHPFLRSEAVYDLAYQKIYGALPNCRECICL